MAFSDAESVATCAGAVVRADRVVDGLEYGRATVGGDDATDTVCDLIERIDRPDVTALLLAGVAPAWFNLLDPERLHEQTGLPTLALSFEASPGLEPAIREQFDGDAREWRLDAYRSLPPRRSLTVNDERLFVRAVGIDENLRFSSASQTQSDAVDGVAVAGTSGETFVVVATDGSADANEVVQDVTGEFGGGGGGGPTFAQGGGIPVSPPAVVGYLRNDD